MAFPKGMKFFKENKGFSECIIEFSPHKRNICCIGTHCNRYPFVKFDFYLIIYIIGYKHGVGLWRQVDPICQHHNPSESYNIRVCGSLKPVETLGDIIHPIDYPHVGPNNMILCQHFNGYIRSFEKYVNTIVNQFFTAYNTCYITNEIITDFNRTLDVIEDNHIIKINKDIQIPLRNLFKM